MTILNANYAKGTNSAKSPEKFALFAEFATFAFKKDYDLKTFSVSKSSSLITRPLPKIRLCICQVYSKLIEVRMGNKHLQVVLKLNEIWIQSKVANQISYKRNQP